MRIEFRSPQGLVLSSLFGLMAVAAFAFAAGSSRPSADFAAGIFALIALFSGAIAVPRIYVQEADQGTFDLMRQWGDVGSIWLGKAMFASMTQGISALLLGILYAAACPLPVTNWIVYLLSCLVLGVAIANTLSLTSTVAIMASNRWLLATVISLPAMYPLIFMAVSAIRHCFGLGSVEGALQSLAAIILYATTPFLIGPWIAAALWVEKRDPVLNQTVSHNEGQE
jgi:heme exporter protein B